MGPSVDIDNCDAMDDGLPADGLCSACLGDAFRAGGVEFVRLTGLKVAMLNGCVGTIVEYDEAKLRFGISVHGHGAPKAVKAENLLPYVLSEEDRCPECSDLVNLHAFPPCACDIIRADHGAQNRSSASSFGGARPYTEDQIKTANRPRTSSASTEQA